MAEHGDMAETSDEHSNGVTEPDDVDLGEIRDELPADLDPSQVTAPYLFPNNSRRKIPAVLYTLIGIGCIVLWQTASDDAVLVNGGFGVAGIVLIEHYAGAFPAWLAPTQVRILPVAEVHADHAHDVAARLRSSGFRVDVVGAVEQLGKRVRNGKIEKLPYILVVGDDDVANDTVGVNKRGHDTPERDVTVDDFIARLGDDVENKV